MLDLKGSSLPKRQQELNEKVKEVVAKKVTFEKIKLLEEKSDVDKLFKIDVASEYRNIDYILEILKSGDSLYISRALKCLWIYEDDYSSFIDPKYLDENIFPLMSRKMTIKMLNSIAMNIRNQDRALVFYTYCKENKLKSTAFKFLIFTSDSHKLEFIKEHDFNMRNNELNFKDLIGNSFNLARVFLQVSPKYSQFEALYQLRHLYTVSSEQYLELLELYWDETFTKTYHFQMKKLGLRICKDILTKHKQRVLKNPALYFLYLNINVIAKHSTAEDAKVYLAALLPDKAKHFWSNFCESYKKIFDLFPQNEVLYVLKQLFDDKYPGEPFEMSEQFYRSKLYKLFTVEQREAWALESLKTNPELLGQDQDYLWYQFVKFEIAFKEIKKRISITTANFERFRMLLTLVDSTKNESDLKEVINYFYQRHVNEKGMNKVDFVEHIYEKYNVFKFNDDTWSAFNKILHSMNVYKEDFFMDQFRTLSIVYHILHKKEIPETLQVDVISETRLHYISGHLEKLSEDEIEIIYKYYINICENNMKELDNKPYDEENKYKISDTISSTLRILRTFKKTKDDIPDIVMKYIKREWKSYKDEKIFASKGEKKITEADLMRVLKKDSTLLLEKLPDFTDYSTISYRFSLTRLMKKLKIYFSLDVAKDCLKMFDRLLSSRDDKLHHSAYYTLVCSVFQIANGDYKIDFMSKYAPTEPKISHDTINRHTLYIQEAICRFVHYSRPAVPLAVVLNYVKGDYVHYCLPMFGAYFANLPKPLTVQFVTAILNAPVSTQKHGLRFAFKCFDVDSLKTLILDVWKGTKNVSLRVIIYTTLFTYLENNPQRDIYEVLKSLTLDINENDQDDIFEKFRSEKRIPLQLRKDFIESTWVAVSKLSEQRSKNIQRKYNVISTIADNVAIMDKEFCRTQIIDEFIVAMLNEKEILATYKGELESLIEAKWKLVREYIMKLERTEEFLPNSILAIVLKKCTEMWLDVHEGMFKARQFLKKFLGNLFIYSALEEDKKKSLPMLKYIVNELEKLIPVQQIYSFYLKFHALILLMETWEYGTKKLDYDVVGADFGVKIVEYISELKAKNLLIPSLYEVVARAISKAVEAMHYNTNLDGDMLVLHVCNYLSNLNDFECFIIALHMLPSEKKQTGYDLSMWSSIINKAKDFDNEGVQMFVWCKFLSDDQVV